jgi:hypothetical protein
MDPHKRGCHLWRQIAKSLTERTREIIEFRLGESSKDFPLKATVGDDSPAWVWLVSERRHATEAEVRSLCRAAIRRPDAQSGLKTRTR